CQSEYQKSYGVTRSRSVSPQRCMPLAGLRSDQIGTSREPGFQHRKRPGPVGLTQSCGSLLGPPDVRHSLTELHSRRPPSVGKPLPSEPDSQPLAPDVQQQQPSVDKVDNVLRWRVGLRSEGQRSGKYGSEYHRQFSWKKPVVMTSPILTAEQVLHSSSRPVPPFKKSTVPMETEYQQNFQGVVPPTGPRLRKHLEQQRIPLFHTYKTHRRRKQESPPKKPRPEQDTTHKDSPSHSPPKSTPHPVKVQREHRMWTEYQSSFRSPLYRMLEGGGATDSSISQARELRQMALLYRHRAWGTNFSRDHLSQLLSEHNTLWEPTDSTDSPTDPPTPQLTSDPPLEPDNRSPFFVEPLDLASNSSKQSSAVGSGEIRSKKKIQTNPGSPAAPHTAWGEEEEEEEEKHTDEYEGRLPTPRLKVRPVQRTHHDRTTPATGGAILVGKLKTVDETSPSKQRCGSAISSTAGSDTGIVASVKPKESWSKNSPTPDHKPAPSPQSKPVKLNQTAASLAAPPPPVLHPQHGIQGTLRDPEFQHNGELGLRFRELQCSGGGCGTDEDDRLSLMSWHSAVSCSMASGILERAQKRQESFWGKR
ncbi:nuclear protein MDM1, partial [Pholidichthys leucotaenia]